MVSTLQLYSSESLLPPLQSHPTNTATNDDNGLTGEETISSVSSMWQLVHVFTGLKSIYCSSQCETIVQQAVFRHATLFSAFVIHVRNHIFKVKSVCVSR